MPQGRGGGENPLSKLDGWAPLPYSLAVPRASRRTGFYPPEQEEVDGEVSMKATKVVLAIVLMVAASLPLLARKKKDEEEKKD